MEHGLPRGILAFSVMLAFLPGHAAAGAGSPDTVDPDFFIELAGRHSCQISSESRSEYAVQQCRALFGAIRDAAPDCKIRLGGPPSTDCVGIICASFQPMIGIKMDNLVPELPESTISVRIFGYGSSDPTNTEIMITTGFYTVTIMDSGGADCGVVGG